MAVVAIKGDGTPATHGIFELAMETCGIVINCKSECTPRFVETLEWNLTSGGRVPDGAILRGESRLDDLFDGVF